jgi:hypothetical protein
MASLRCAPANSIHISGVSRRAAAKLLGVDESTVRADTRENPAPNAGKSRTPDLDDDDGPRFIAVFEL